MKKWTIAIHVMSIIALTILLSLVYNWTKEDPWNSWSQWLAIGGTLASVDGIALTLYQLRHLKSTTDTIQEELQKKSESTQSLLSYGELEKQEQSLRSMSSYLQAKQYAMVEAQLHEAQKVLFEIVNVESLKDVVEGNIDVLIQNIGIDIVNVTDAWTKGGYLNQTELLKHNNNIITLLQKASSILKQQGI